MLHKEEELICSMEDPCCIPVTSFGFIVICMTKRVAALSVLVCSAPGSVCGIYASAALMQGPGVLGPCLIPGKTVHMAKL